MATIHVTTTHGAVSPGERAYPRRDPRHPDAHRSRVWVRFTDVASEATPPAGLRALAAGAG